MVDDFPFNCQFPKVVLNLFLRYSLCKFEPTISITTQWNNWFRTSTLPETNMAPENGWLEYHRFLLGPGLFSGANLLLVSGSGMTHFESRHINTSWWLNQPNCSKYFCKNWSFPQKFGVKKKFEKSHHPEYPQIQVSVLHCDVSRALRSVPRPKSSLGRRGEPPRRREERLLCSGSCNLGTGASKPP